MFHPSSIRPDVELKDFLQGNVSVDIGNGQMEPVIVYGDWEKPSNEVPDDFIVVFNNGDVSGVGLQNDYANGYLMVSYYSRLNDDGSVKKNRVTKVLEQFDILVNKCITENYFYKYVPLRFITPTTPNISSGYSVTTLNISWHTTNNFNK